MRLIRHIYYSHCHGLIGVHRKPDISRTKQPKQTRPVRLIDIVSEAAVQVLAK
jgi:hypothetical protein